MLIVNCRFGLAVNWKCDGEPVMGEMVIENEAAGWFEDLVKWFAEEVEKMGVIEHGFGEGRQIDASLIAG
jgi:hypothetical protein